MKIQLPWIGNAAGTTGNMILQTVRGRTYMREKPIYYHDPKTQAQLDQRKRWYYLFDEWNRIYPLFSSLIPKAQRTNRNVYDDMLKDAYFVTYINETIPARPILSMWGLDDDNQVKCVFSSLQWSIDYLTVSFSCNLLSLSATRRFSPRNLVAIAVDVSRGRFMCAVLPYSSSSVAVSWSNSRGFAAEDEVYFYVALCDDAYISNFYLPAL